MSFACLPTGTSADAGGRSARGATGFSAARECRELLACWLQVAVLAITSCGTSSQTHEPPVSLPDSFSAAGEAPQRERWWLAFEDPELDKLVGIALQDNLDLLGAWDRLAQAAARAKNAGAGLWPSLDAEAGAGYSTSDMTGTSSFSLGLVTQYEIDVWGRVRNSRDAARADFLASGQSLKATAIGLSATVASAWYRLVERRAQLALLQEQDLVNQQVLELVTMQFRGGRAKAADVLQQRQLAESNRGDRAAIGAQIEVLEHQLAILLGVPPSEVLAQPVATLIDLPPLPRLGLPSELLQRRPDIQAALLQVRAADSRVAAAIAEQFPRLSISARTSTSAPDVRDLFSNWLVNFGANLLAPVFQGRRLQAETDLSRASAAQALHHYGGVILNALREVEDALAEERQRRKLLESLDKQVELSAQVIERTRDNYTKGAETFLRVLDAMLKHQVLQRAQKSTRLELIQDRIALCRAIAGGWQLERPIAIDGLSSAGGETADGAGT